MPTDDATDATPYTGPDYGMGDDNALAHEVSQRDWRNEPRTHNLQRTGWARPVSAVVDAGQAEGLRAEATPALTVSALSPETAAPIIRQLAGLTPEQRAKREPELVMQTLRAASDKARIMTGLGSDATPLAKAQVNLAYREREFERRIDSWAAKLNEQTGARAVIDPETGKAVIDPATGQPKMDPIYAMSDGQRAAGQAEMNELLRQLSVLRGPEGDRELDEALKATVQLKKELGQQQADLVEVERRAQGIVRDEDLNRRAAVLAKSLRNTVN